MLDPEGIADEPAGWWWNPLSYVTSDRRAIELTDAFVGAYRHILTRDRTRSLIRPGRSGGRCKPYQTYPLSGMLFLWVVRLLICCGWRARRLG